MRSDLPSISVIIPTYRRPERLERLLAALDRQTLAPERFEVIVVDDCSGDHTPEIAAKWASKSAHRIELLETPVNGGPAPARNLGAARAHEELLAFIDDDVVPSPGWLEAGVDALATDERIGVVQGHTAPPATFDPTRVEPWTVSRFVTGPTPHFEACNIFYRRAPLLAAGGFDEEIAWWGEDTAAGWSVVEQGWRRDFAEAALAVHDIEVRGFWHHLRHAYLEQNVVTLGARHPGFRASFFWKRWAVRPAPAALAAAVLGLIIGLRWRRALLATVPYLWLQRPSVRQPRFFSIGATTVATDIAQLAGHIVGSVRNRTIVL